LGDLKFDFDKNKSFEKMFKSFETEYKNFISLTKDGKEVELIDVKSVQNSANKLKKLFSLIVEETKSIDGFDKLDIAKKLFPQSFTKDTSAALKAISEYEAGLKRLANCDEDLKRLREERDKLNEAFKKELKVKSLEDGAKELDAIRNNISAINNEIKDLENKKIEIETAYKTNKDKIQVE
jgi:hypothetical protein